MRHTTTDSTPDGTLPGLTPEVLDAPGSRWFAVVVGLLDRQRALCERLEMLSREQAGHVKEARADALVGVLADRQRVIDEVISVNDQLEPFRSRRERLMQRLSPNEQLTIDSRVEQITSSIERVRVQDEADRAALEERRRGVADELTGLVRGRGAVAAYGSGLRQEAGGGLDLGGRRG
ncbi:MAG: hypothetical protein ACK4WH_12130 [Phycisphaerales bacterium]